MSSGTLSMGVSATAMHYVSEKPCNIEEHVHMVGANHQEKKNLKTGQQGTGKLFFWQEPKSFRLEVAFFV